MTQHVEDRLLYLSSTTAAGARPGRITSVCCNDQEPTVRLSAETDSVDLGFVGLAGSAERLSQKARAAQRDLVVDDRRRLLAIPAPQPRAPRDQLGDGSDRSLRLSRRCP